MSHKAFLAALAAMSVSVGVGVAALQRPSPPIERDTAGATASSVASVIQVHVAGWVASRGVVSLTDGAIVADAVEAAGGLLPGADTDSLNLAARVEDGFQVLVGGPGSDGSGDRGDGRVAVNQATADELEALPGVGPVLAQRIVAFREENGPFTEVEDLLDVPGIGESKLSSLRDVVRIP